LQELSKPDTLDPLERSIKKIPGGKSTNASFLQLPFFNYVAKCRACCRRHRAYLRKEKIENHPREQVTGEKIQNELL